MTPAEDYCKSLLLSGHGVPLFHPDQPGDMSVEIGDVCFRTRRGQLFRLFNVTKDAEDPRNQCGLPDGFEKLHVSVRSLPHYMRPGQVVHSQDVRVSTPSTHCMDTMSVTLPKAKQAFVVAQNGAQRCIATGAGQDVIADYIVRNIGSWFLFARSKGHQIADTDLILICGWVKTNNWALGVSQRDHTEVSIHGNCTAEPTEPISLEYSDPTFQGKAGPNIMRLANLNTSCNLLCDQALFITYYKTKRRFLLPGVTPILVPSDDEIKSKSWFSFSSMVSRIRGTSSDPLLPIAQHPVDIALNYILKNSNCDMAVACDTDIYDIIGDTPYSYDYDLNDIFNKAKPAVVTNGNNTFGTLLPRLVHVQDTATYLEVPGYGASASDNVDPASSFDRLSDIGVISQSEDKWQTSATTKLRANGLHLLDWISSKLHHAKTYTTTLYHDQYSQAPECPKNSPLLV